MAFAEHMNELHNQGLLTDEEFHLGWRSWIRCKACKGAIYVWKKAGGKFTGSAAKGVVQACRTGGSNGHLGEQIGSCDLTDDKYHGWDKCTMANGSY